MFIWRLIYIKHSLTKSSFYISYYCVLATRYVWRKIRDSNPSAHCWTHSLAGRDDNSLCQSSIINLDSLCFFSIKVFNCGKSLYSWLPMRALNPLLRVWSPLCKSITLMRNCLVVSPGLMKVFASRARSPLIFYFGCRTPSRTRRSIN